MEASEKSSRASLQANQTGYEVGVRINLDVLNAQQQLYNTMRELALARYNTVITGLRLRANSGMLSEADLVAINPLLREPGTPGTSILDLQRTPPAAASQRSQPAQPAPATQPAQPSSTSLSGLRLSARQP